MLVLVVGAALIFDYVNGFHDTANAMWRYRAYLDSSEVVPEDGEPLSREEFEHRWSELYAGMALLIGLVPTSLMEVLPPLARLVRHIIQ